MLALRDDCPTIKSRRKPLVLVKNRVRAEQQKNVADIAAVVRADEVRFDVRLVVAHEDTDAVEPSHEELSARIEQHLRAEGIDAVAATPAWEMEAWWYQWPSAVLAVNTRWRHPNRGGTEVGLIRNVKEQLTRDLRPRGGARTRDYEESDSPEIAEHVEADELVDERAAISRSFNRFAERFRAADL